MLLVGGGVAGSRRFGPRLGAALAVGGWGLVVEEIETSAKTEGVIVLFVEGLALSFGPKVVRVLRYGRPSRGRSRL